MGVVWYERDFFVPLHWLTRRVIAALVLGPVLFFVLLQLEPIVERVGVRYSLRANLPELELAASVDNTRHVRGCGESHARYVPGVVEAHWIRPETEG